MNTQSNYSSDSTKMLRSVGLGVKYGAITAAILLAYFLLLIALDMNTLALHGMGKMLVLGVMMFYAFYTFKENRRRIKFYSSLKLGLVTALTAAIVLLLGEFILHGLLHIKLAPKAFLAAGVHPISSYVLLSVEMMVYGILACIACTTYFKRPRTEPLSSANTDPFMG